MNINQRRVVFLGFLIFFLITAPLLVLSTMGYRLNLKTLRIEKIGLLFITSSPKEVSVSLNNKPVADSTPLRLKNILPNTYEVSLSKDGYFSWTKKLEVKSGETTFAADIRLYKKNLPGFLKEGKADTLTLFQPQFFGDESLFAVFSFPTGKELWLLNPEDQSQQTLLFRTLPNSQKNSLSLLEWLPSYRLALVEEVKEKKSEYLLLYVDDPKNSFSINSLFLEEIRSIFYHEQENLLYASDALGQLWQINPITKKTQRMIGVVESDFFILNGNIFSLKKNKDGILRILKQPIAIFSLQDSGEKHEQGKISEESPLPENFFHESALGEYEIFPWQEDAVSVRNTRTDDFLISDKRRIKEPIFGKANYIEKNSNGELLYFNNFELFLLSSPSSQPELVNRYGQKIQKALWFPAHDALAVLIENKIFIVERDGRDRRNIIQISDIPEAITDMAIGKDGTVLYYTTEKGLYAQGLE